MPTEAFRRFRYSFFEDPDSPRNGLDTAALSALGEPERTHAADLLIVALPDTRAVIGLGVLRPPRAEAALRAIVADPANMPSSRDLVELAKSLWLIHPDRRWIAMLTDALERGDDWTLRMAAACALLEARDGTAVPALITALDDAEPLVRHHAARALLALHGLPHASGDSRHMIYRVMGAGERHDSGRRDIVAAIAGRPGEDR